MAKICFTGVGPLGGVLLRGKQVARSLGVPFLDLEREFLTNDTHWDVVVLVKYHRGKGAEIRRRASRLIYDPLDCWSSLRDWAHRPAEKFWRWTRAELGFDDIIGTSPACCEVMERALPTVRTHLAYHHADPTIGVDGSWFDPMGPIVYAGGLRFLGDDVTRERLRKAAAMCGRDLVINCDRCCERSLKGASLALSLRLSPEDTDLNRHCKPTIKGMNAAAGGIPFMASDDPAHRSAHPEAYFVNEELSWEANFARALCYPAQTSGVSLAQHVGRMAEIISGDGTDASDPTRND